ncbi:MAG: hypothetical protein E7056_05715 [Lentisphaerae bacterium]|nr:hypothetical protein [Lentisphaerota bacterium]
MFKQGPVRAASHRLIFENSPENWQNGFPVGNGMFGGLVYQPEETVMEMAFTRHNHWRNNLKKWDRLTLQQLREIDKNAPDTMEKMLSAERRGKIEPCFKPGGRLRIWQDEFGGAPAGNFFDRRQELDLAAGEVQSGYELAGKAMERITLVDPAGDVAITHVRDTYLHELQLNTYLAYTQRIELYRLYDPDVIIHNIGTAEDGISYIEFSFGEELRTIIAFKVDGVPWHTPVAQGCSVSVEIDLDYINAAGPLSYTVFQTMIVSEDGSGNLLAQAREVLNRAAAEGFESIQKRNREFWNSFWQQSGITLGNPALEALYYNNLYQYGAQSRGDVAPALFGLWNAERSAPWCGRYTGDINVAMYCWPLAALNHPEMLEGMFRTIERWIPVVREETLRTYGVDGLRFPAGCGLRGEETAPSMYRLMSCASGFYMDFYRKAAACYPDKETLRKRIYPVMLAAAKFYIALADRDSSGKLRFGPSWAPEQGVIPAWNVSNDLGLIKPLWQAVVAMDSELQLNTPEAAQIAELLKEFPDYPQKEGEFIDSASEPGRTELCHPGYLACVIPGDDVDADSPLAAVAQKTLREHLDHTCRKPLAGKIGSGCDLTWGWMLAAAIRLRDSEFANIMLEQVGLEDFVKSNGMFAYIGGRTFKSISEKRAGYDVKNTQPHSLTSQSGCVRARDYAMTMVQSGGGFMFSVQEAMLQSHKNQIKLFPCMLNIFGNKASFHNFRAEGGLVVSAAWQDGKVVYFRISSTRQAYHGTLRWFGSNHISEDLAVAPQRSLKQLAADTFELELAPNEVIEWGNADNACAADEHPPVIKSYNDKIAFDYGRKGPYYL